MGDITTTSGYKIVNNWWGGDWFVNGGRSALMLLNLVKRINRALDRAYKKGLHEGNEAAHE